MKKRKIITTLLLFLSFYYSYAQLIMIDGETGEYRYEDVARAEGINSSEIKERAARWLDEYYSKIDSVKTDSNAVSQTNTYKFTWKLIKKSMPVQMFFDVEIKTKDNRYKYDFYNFRVGKINLGDIQAISLKKYIDRFPHEYQINIEQPIDEEMTRAIASLNYFINHNKMEVDEEDW